MAQAKRMGVPRASSTEDVTSASTRMLYCRPIRDTGSRHSRQPQEALEPRAFAARPDVRAQGRVMWPEDAGVAVAGSAFGHLHGIRDPGWEQRELLAAIVRAQALDWPRRLWQHCGLCPPGP